MSGRYVLTGGNRPYIKRLDMPDGLSRIALGAVSWWAIWILDLDDTLVKGGKLNTWYTGVNWWASRQWKFGMGYGLADLDRFSTTGRTQRFFTRVQWIY